MLIQSPRIDTTAQLAALKVERDDLSAELERTKTELEAQKGKINQLKWDLEDVKAECRQLNSDLESSTLEIASQRAKCDDCEKDLSTALADLRSTKGTLDDTRESLDARSMELQAARTETQRAVAEVAALKADLDRRPRTEDLRSAQDESNRLKDSLETLKKELAAKPTTEQLAAMEADAGQLREEVRRLKKDLADRPQAGQLQAAEGEAQRLRAEVESLQQQLAALPQAKEEARQLQGQVESLQQQLAERPTTEQLKAAEDEASKLRDEVNSLKQQPAETPKAEDEARQLQEQVESLQQQLAERPTAEDEARQLEEQVESLQQQLAERPTADQLAAAQDEAQRLREELVSLKQAEMPTAEQLRGLDAMEALETEAQHLREKVQILDIQLAQPPAGERLQAAEAEAERLREEVEALKRQLAESSKPASAVDPEAVHCAVQQGEKAAEAQKEQSAPNAPLVNEVDCELRIIAINGIYQLDNMARLKSCVEANRTPNTIVACAGDFVAPSLLSALDKGRGMVDLMNRAGVTHVTIGNHESNIPLAELLKRYDESKFVWINSNMPDVDLKGRPKMPEFVILDVTSEKGARKVGLIGVNTDDPRVFSADAFGGCKILSPFDTAKRLAQELEGQVDCVVPLTHLYMPDDRKLAAMGLGFPVAIGGHDHDVHHEIVKGQHIVKVGSDAQRIGIVDLVWMNGSKKPVVNVRIDDAMLYEPDPELLQHIDVQRSLIKNLEKTQLAVFPVGVPMTSVGMHDGPTTIGTFLSTAVREAFKSDCCFVRGDCYRGESSYPTDQVYFSYGDLVREMPHEFAAVVVALPGKVIQDTIHYSFTKLAGTRDLLHLDNQIIWDPQTETVTHIRNQPVDPDRKYDTVVIHSDLMDEPGLVPLVKWAKENPHDVPNIDAGVSLHIALVDYWSSAVWLQLARFELGINFDGVISPEELKRGLQQLYPDAALADLIFDNLMACADTDGDGRISLHELLQVTIQCSDWAAMDADQDRSVTRGEFQPYLEGLVGGAIDAATVDQVFQELDHDGSGQISQQEVRTWIARKRAAAIGITAKGKHGLLH